MICPAWDLLIQHLQVSSRLAEAFLFSGPLMETRFGPCQRWGPGIGLLEGKQQQQLRVESQKRLLSALDKNGFDRGGHLQNYIDCGGRY
jgi:hypothetical protein